MAKSSEDKYYKAELSVNGETIYFFDKAWIRSLALDLPVEGKFVRMKQISKSEALTLRMIT